MEYKVSKNVFNKTTLLKIVCLWQKDFNITIAEDEYNYILTVDSKNVDVFNAEQFNKELQEQQLRENLNNQFGNLRDYIYKKAFSNF